MYVICNPQGDYYSWTDRVGGGSKERSAWGYIHAFTMRTGQGDECNFGYVFETRDEAEAKLREILDNNPEDYAKDSLVQEAPQEFPIDKDGPVFLVTDSNVVYEWLCEDSNSTFTTFTRDMELDTPVLRVYTLKINNCWPKTAFHASLEEAVASLKMARELCPGRDLGIKIIPAMA